jgi:protein-S-isoprenylcysteine O-methyltransferase Ste14
VAALSFRRIPFFRHRIAWSRAAVILALAYALFVPAPAAIPRGWLDISQWLGFALLIVAALGRVWCLSYISGVKNDVLVAEGPYSVVRNPLYVFSFIGAVGFGLAVENPVLAALLAIAFAVFYPSVIRQEEETLTQAFGERFARYCGVTPRWIPRWSNFHEPESWSINPRRFRDGLLDAMWFLWVFLIWDILEKTGTLQWIRNL